MFEAMTRCTEVFTANAVVVHVMTYDSEFEKNLAHLIIMTNCRAVYKMCGGNWVMFFNNYDDAVAAEKAASDAGGTGYVNRYTIGEEVPIELRFNDGDDDLW